MALDEKRSLPQCGGIICQSELWVNPRFPHLACSPDGLIGEDRLLDIKSLKIFSEHRIDNVIKDSGILGGKDTQKRMLFC